MARSCFAVTPTLASRICPAKNCRRIYTHSRARAHIRKRATPQGDAHPMPLVSGAQTKTGPSPLLVPPAVHASAQTRRSKPEIDRTNLT